MRRIITDEERQIIELTKAGKTARDISNALSINRSHVYYVLRANDIMPLKGLYPVEEIGEYTKEHTFKETMERFDLSQYALRRIVRTNGFSCKRKRRDMKGNNWNYRDIDIEHLKAHAHEYNCTEYYRKFNTPCTRTTLRNRAIELGLDWKNDREDVDRQVLEFAKESAGVLTRNEYIDQCHERFGVSKDRACRIAREGGYKMLRAPHPQGNLYTEEEDAIMANIDNTDIGRKYNENMKKLREQARKLKEKLGIKDDDEEEEVQNQHQLTEEEREQQRNVQNI